MQLLHGLGIFVLRVEHENDGAAVAKDFKVFYAQVQGKTAGSYTVDHTAGSYVFDPAGRLRLFVRYGSGADALASDLKALLASSPG